MDGVDELEVPEDTNDEVEEEKEEPESVFLEAIAADDDDLSPPMEAAEAASLTEALRRDPVDMETLFFSSSIEGDDDGSTAVSILEDKDAVVWSWCAARFSAKRFSRFRPSIRRRSSSAIRFFISVTLA